MLTNQFRSGRVQARTLALALPAVLGVGLASPAEVACADEITLHYDFQKPRVSQVMIAGQLYDRVTMADCANGGLTGQPRLPACGAQILLPPGSEVISVQVIPDRRASMGEGYFIEPVAEPVPISQMAEARPPVADPAIYRLHQPFPDATFEEVGIYAFRGYQMLTLKLQPVIYVPASGELSYFPQLTVVVNTTRPAAPSVMFRELEADEQAAAQKVDNPEMIASYPKGGPDLGKGFDLLIITAPELASAFEPLRDYHNTHDIPTEIHTTDDVGSTDPVVIRDYIRDRYINDGIEYVIIGADHDFIPCKHLYVDTTPLNTTNQMPGDIFYSCLDGSWNWDNDDKWGEPNDGEGGGDVDLVAEVYVGRACAGGPGEVTRFVNKTLWYLGAGHSRPENVLLVGQQLRVDWWGGDYMDDLIDGCSKYGYTTVGIPSDVYDVETLYERDEDWNKWDLIDKLDAGVNLLNHLGHGWWDQAMQLYNHDILWYVHNTDLCFVYSQTCYAGCLDYYDCWAEHMNVKIDEGAFAVIMNARVGYISEPTDGPSPRYNREFWDAVFNPLEGMPELGKANSDSKEDNIWRINEVCMRWVCYGLNLFGDPTVAIREMSGMGVSPSPQFHANGPSGGPFTPDQMTFALINHNDTPIEFEVSEWADWIDLSTAGGTIPANGETEVTACINDFADDFPNGRYEDTIHFVNVTDHEGDATRTVTLDVGEFEPRIVWNLDSDPGWSMEGSWGFGQPTGGGGEYGYTDPISGKTGDNVYGYNLYGDYENNMSERHLTTTAIDCTDLANVHLEFWWWLGVDIPTRDHAYIRVSTNGVGWDNIWENTKEVTDQWQHLSFDISDWADGQPTVYLRWTMGRTNDDDVFCGWNIDDIEIWGIELPAPCRWDLDWSGLVDIDDLFEVLDHWGETGGFADVNSDGIVDIDDVFAILAHWGPCP